MSRWPIICIAVLAVGFVVIGSAEKAGCPPGWPLCWVPCNYTEVQGPTCHDCNTRVICTAIGGLLRPCSWPGKRHCVNGQCVSQPSDECAQTTTTEVETTTTEVETTTTEVETTTTEVETTTTAAITSTTEAITSTNEVDTVTDANSRND